MARASLNLKRIVLTTTALMLTGLCAGCGSFGDPAGYAVATQDKYDFMTCKEIVGSRTGLVTREKELTALLEKAQTSPGGFIAGAMAYRSELGQTRTLLRIVERAAQTRGCDAKP